MVYDGLRGRQTPAEKDLAALDRDAEWEGAYSALGARFNTLLGLAADSNRCQAAAAAPTE